jgi:transmembrane sensor
VKPGSATPPFDALEQAADWYALLQSSEATEHDHARWRVWFDASASHQEAWALALKVRDRFAPLQSSGLRRQATDAYHAARVSLAKRRALLGITALAGSGMLGWALLRDTSLPLLAQALVADQRSATGEIREVALTDGTHVWLNTASAFNIDFDASLRRIHLLAGEILISTAADPARPLVVDTAQGRMRALGTRFTVRLEDELTLLAVYQGAVEVAPAASDARQVVRAGQQVRFGADRIDAVEAADPAREAWAQGRLVASNISLQALVAELSRYTHGHLGVAPEVADLRVLGSYPVLDTDRTLDMLAQVLPIRIHRPLPWWTTIRAAASTASMPTSTSRQAGG